MSGRGCTEWCETSIPTDLRAVARWVAWRYVERDGRATKVPICARAGEPASATDPTTWTEYASASRYARAHGCGIGIMLGDGLAGVDLDDCLSAAGEPAPWAREIVAELDSYTETSPSGHGLHVLVRGTLPGARRRRGPIEMYDHSRYFCVTGRHLPWTPCTVEERTDALVVLHRRVFGLPRDARVAGPPTLRQTILCPSDSEIIERAHRARNGARFGRLWRGDTTGYDSTSEADLALCSMLAWYTEDGEQIVRLVAQSGLARPKWERQDYREGTIAAALASVSARRRTAADRSAHTEALLARELGL